MQERPMRSELRHCGLTNTLTEVHGWAREVASDARYHLKGDIAAHVWAARSHGHLMLSCDLKGQGGSRYMVTITAGGSQYFHTRMGTEAEALVADLAEAIHIVGIITRMLDAAVTIGMQNKEVNPAILAKELQPGTDNGDMALALLGKQP